MAAVNKREDYDIETYKGLAHATARRFEKEARRKGVEYDDFVQILLIRVWRAIEAYDPTRSTMTIRRFVFQCVTNQVKDVLKKKANTDAHIADILPETVILAGGEPSEWGDDTRQAALRFLSVSEDEAFAPLFDEDELPGGLSDEETMVAGMLVDGLRPAVIAQRLDCKIGHVRAVIAAMRLKLGPDMPTADPSAA